MAAIDFSPAVPESDGAFHDGLLLAVKSDGEKVFYNSQGKEAFTLPEGVEPLSDFYGQRALVKDVKTNLVGYINTKGALAVPCLYETGATYSEGIASVSLPGSEEKLVIDRFGRVVSKFKKVYSSDYIFNGGLALVYNQDGGIGFIDTSGTLVVPSSTIMGAYTVKDWWLCGMTRGNTDT
ncbi:WG repeat-containing protein [Paenibacillus tepidiphilus]|uniref:WG repeat-containing protein n=1 Tax=Paenibacillus tepidiphilus TaxID=2608683 RepID=UPI001EF005E9|nr:WG repeat-containing protein [Paenibacillus tepidiphilus]